MGLTYNTTRYQQMTTIADGQITVNQVVDTQNDTDMTMLAQYQQSKVSKTYVRPAAVAVIDGDGIYHVGEVDGLVVNGEWHNAKGRAMRVEVSHYQGGDVMGMAVAAKTYVTIEAM